MNEIISKVITGVIAALILALLGGIWLAGGTLLKPADGEHLKASAVAWVISGYVVAAVFAGLCIFAHFTRRHHTREQYALLFVVATTTLVLATLLSCWSGLLPWHCPSSVRAVIRDESPSAPALHWAEYVVAVFLLLIALTGLSLPYDKWSGLKSVAQHDSEQRQEQPNLAADAWSEFVCMVRRRPPRPIYSPDPTAAIASALAGTQEEQPWKDESRELVGLSFPYFSFVDADWHYEFESWVGRHVDTGDRVLLHPCQTCPSVESIKGLVSYAGNIPTHKPGPPVTHVIVAVYDADPATAGTTAPGGLVEILTRSTLLNRLVKKFEEYRSRLRQRVRAQRLPDSELTLTDTYVPSELTAISGAPMTGTAEDYLNGWLLEQGQRHLALLGEYGQGKSTTAQVWALQQFEAAAGGVPDRIPILLELRGKSPRNLTPLGLLGEWGSQYAIDGKTLWQLHQAGRLVIIFEGFDEMSLVGDSELRLQHFQTIWQFAHRQAKILITGRPNFFLDDQEMKASLGIASPVGDAPYCEAVRLKPFTPDQIESALRSAPQTVREQVTLLARDRPQFLELASRPSILHVVSTLWMEENLAEKVDRLTSAYVMSLFIDKSYRRQGEKEGAGALQFSGLTTPERKYFMSGIAAHMCVKQLPNTISGEELNRLIDRLLDAAPTALHSSAPATTGETRRPLQERVRLDPRYGRGIVRADVRTCCLLVDDPVSPGHFRFPHKSILEYLFAELMYRNFAHSSDVVASATANVTNAGLSDLESQPVSISYFAELYKAGLPQARTSQEGSKELITSLFRDFTGRWAISQRLGRWYLEGRLFLFASWNAKRPISRFGLLTRSQFRTSVGQMLIFLVLVPSLSIPVMMALLNSSHGQSSMQSFLFYAYIAAIAFIVGIIYPFANNLRNSLRRNTRIALQILRSLGISSAEIHQALGTNSISAIRDIDYYRAFFMAPDTQATDIGK